MSQDRETLLRLSKKKIPQLSIPSSKQEPVYKDKWITADREKRNNFIKTCDNHQFCSIPYDFVKEKKTKQETEKDRVKLLQIIKQIPLLQAQSAIVDNHREILPNVQQLIQFSNLTEHSLDDWFFQSFNRPLMSAFDPKKKYEIAASYYEELKNRYSKMRNSNKSNDKVLLYLKYLVSLENKEYYFQDMASQPRKKDKFIKQNGKSVLNPQNLLFEYQKLETKSIQTDQIISIRENDRLKKKKQNKSRRNAVYLDYDENYRKIEVEQTINRLRQHKEVEKLKNNDEEMDKVANDQFSEEEPHLFIPNVDNYLRNSLRRQCNDLEEVQSSFVQHELQSISAKISLQKQIQKAIDNDFLVSQTQNEGYFTKATHKDYFINDITETQIQLSKQHMQFKSRMEQAAKQFKDYLKDNRNEQPLEQQQPEIKIPQQLDHSHQHQHQNISKGYKSESLQKKTQTASTQSGTERNKSREIRSRQDRSKQKNKKSKSIAEQMADWYNISKQERSGLNIDPKQIQKMLNQERGVEIKEEVIFKTPEVTEVVEQMNKQKMKRRQMLLRENEKSANYRNPLEVLIMSDKNESTIERNPREKLTQNLNRLKQMSVQLLNSDSDENILYNTELMSFSAHVQEITDPIKKPVYE